MAGEHWIVCNMVNNNCLATRSNLVADGCSDFKLATRLEPEANIVADSTGNPALFRDSRDRRKSHTCGAAHYVQNGWYGVDAADCCDFRSQSVDSAVHETPFPDVAQVGELQGPLVCW